ncbi:hypothetical protein HMPREF9096_00955 [Haemophilus sp. oral taxon 851 str. F0397]|nr:hypothetical protein HMPREF9096_00955 [Haemophilus sp. oral taxon 851 str. F0397]
MENFCEITFCQQIGSNKRHNQDALFNGEAVSKRLKNVLKTDRTLLWVWQMVFPIVIDLKKRASWQCNY